MGARTVRSFIFVLHSVGNRSSPFETITNNTPVTLSNKVSFQNQYDEEFRQEPCLWRWDDLRPPTFGRRQSSFSPFCELLHNQSVISIFVVIFHDFCQDNGWLLFPPFCHVILRVNQLKFFSINSTTLSSLVVYSSQLHPVSHPGMTSASTAFYPSVEATDAENEGAVRNAVLKRFVTDQSV